MLRPVRFGRGDPLGLGHTRSRISYHVEDADSDSFDLWTPDRADSPARERNEYVVACGKSAFLQQAYLKPLVSE